MSALSPVMPPADIEGLVVQYLAPRLGLPVGTRLPNPANDADTVDGFCRVEAAGGIKVNLTQWDLDIIVHGYHPNEVTAAQITASAVAILEAARHQQFGQYWIGDSDSLVAPAKQTDPLVNLPRYRSMVSWRVTGPESNPPVSRLARAGQPSSGGDRNNEATERSRQ